MSRYGEPAFLVGMVAGQVLLLLRMLGHPPGSAQSLVLLMGLPVLAV